MRIAVLLLCHEAPAEVAASLDSPFFRHPDIKVYVHHDGRHPASVVDALRAAIPEGVACQVLDDRVVVAWGEYSIVEATRRLMAAALDDRDFGAGHLLLASASCQPIRPVSSLQRFLAERPGTEFIQAHDIRTGRWTVDGLEEERFQWFFPFNYATQRRLFEFASRWQRRLRVRRRVPPGLVVHFGSQWFCLTRPTAAAVVEKLADPGLQRFFRRSWIPDEFAIQTLVAMHCEPAAIAQHGLTYYEFDRQGRPLVLEDDHVDHVLAQPFFFARKVAPEALRLRDALRDHCAREEQDTSWFPRAGRPTWDFRDFVARAEREPSMRAAVGSFLPWEGGPMAANARRYYVLHASSRAYLARLLRCARAGGGAPVFDFPFDRNGPQLAAERHQLFGFTPEDRHRARYDEIGFLRELVNAGGDAARPVAFGLDPSTGSPVVSWIERDPNAVIVDCDPPGLPRRQRAAAWLAQLPAVHEAWRLAPMLEALRSGAPLPQDRWREPADRLAPGATRVALDRLACVADDATVRALVAAARVVPCRMPGPDDAELILGPGLAPLRPAQDG